MAAGWGGPGKTLLPPRSPGAGRSPQGDGARPYEVPRDFHAMKVLGSRGPAERILTFAPAADAPEEGLLRLLADAARHAELAEHELSAAKAAYGRAPTPRSLDELRRVSLRTLEAEAAFDRAWRHASARWFGHPPT